MFGEKEKREGRTLPYKLGINITRKIEGFQIEIRKQNWVAVSTVDVLD